jgi:hypothetical protein
MTEEREEGEEGRSETMGYRRSEATDGRRGIHNFLSKVTHLSTVLPSKWALTSDSFSLVL